jgi:hypothetical protein
VSHLDHRTIEPDELLQRHAVPQRHEKPSEDVARGNIREKSIALDHRDSVDGENEPVQYVNIAIFLLGFEDGLMLFRGVRCNGHEGIRENGDEDSPMSVSREIIRCHRDGLHDEEVADD